MDAFADRLLFLRYRFGPTQAAFAKRAGIGLRTVGRYENGKTRPSRNQVEKMARNLAVRAEWIMTGEGDMRWKYYYRVAAALESPYPMGALTRELLRAWGLRP